MTDAAWVSIRIVSLELPGFPAASTHQGGIFVTLSTFAEDPLLRYISAEKHVKRQKRIIKISVNVRGNLV
jgi:predicted metal-binding protein